MTDPISAKAKIDVGIQGVGSQAYVVAMSVIACLCATATIFFLWHEHPYTWVPGAMTAVFALLATWKHGKSQVFLDLAGAPLVKLTGKELAVEMPAASLTDQTSVQMLHGLIANAFYRTPLPPPDGMVGERFEPNQSPEALHAAQAAVNKINEESVQAHNRIGQLLQPHPTPDDAIEVAPKLVPPENIPPLSDLLMPDSEASPANQGEGHKA